MFAAFTACFLSPKAEAAIRYVTQGGTGSKEGTSWENAYGEAEFSTAIQSADAGDEIWVAVGVYRPSTAMDESATFQLKSGVALYGGFGGDETTRDARDWENNLTVLTGDLARDDTGANLNGGITVSADYIVIPNSDTVVIGSGTDDTALLDGFTICGGDKGTDSGSGEYCGGGMFNNSGDPTVRNCTFSGNTAHHGGGMYNYNSSPTVTDCSFSKNTDDGSFDAGGGGMYNENLSNPKVTGCTFSENRTTLGSGGGMCNDNSSPRILDCIFTGNNTNRGGGMYSYESDIVVTRCTFIKNTATDFGGGMYNYSSIPTVTDCTFSENRTTLGSGGGMYNDNSDPVVTNCTFSENYAGNSGGGMGNIKFSDPTVTNCTFSGNAVENHGGGMFNETLSDPTVTNCTFSENTTNNTGGGMFSWYSSSPTVTNCIFWGDKAGNTGNEIMNENNSNPTVTYSVVSADPPYAGVGNLNTDPHLKPLHYNGGATRTCAISDGSSSIGKGTSVGIWESISLDQRGISRDVVSPDIGAYEYRPDLKILTVDTEGSGTASRNPVGTPFGTWENQWYYGTGNSAVTLEASPDFPWVFTQWSGDASGTVTTTEIVMSEDRRVLAVFTRQWGIVASAGTGGTINPSGNITVISGDDQAFTVTPDGGYAIEDVKIDGSSIAPQASLLFTKVAADHTIEASFARQYNIVASAGTGGTIAPSGNVTVISGDDQAFTITPEGGYIIEDVRVDGTSQGALTSYTFTNVTEDHSIAAFFARQHNIVASAGTGGTIAPSGSVTVISGDDQAFTITPEEGYVIEDVRVDENSQGALTSYTFTSVTKDHSITASFAPEPTTSPSPTAVPGPTIPPFLPTPDPEIPLPDITLTLTLVSGGEILAGPIEEPLTEELLNVLLLGNWLSEKDFQNLLLKGYNSGILSLFALGLKLDDGAASLTLILDITVTSDLPEGYTYRIYLLGRTYDEEGNPTGFTVLADNTDGGTTLLHKRGKTETWKVRVFDGSEADGNPEKGYISTEIRGIVVVIPGTSPTLAPSVSGGGGGCALGAIPPLLLLLLPLASLFRK